VRIAYYTHPAFLEPALCLVRELSHRADVHLFLEISDGAWKSAAFDLEPRQLPAGLVPADGILRDAFPAGVRQYWQSAASFHFVVHPSPRSLHLSSWRVSREALRFAVSTGADLLHVDDLDVSPRLALALPGFRRLPLVIAVHDPEPHSGERNWRKTLARRIAYPRARRFVLHNHALAMPFASQHGLQASNIDTVRLGAYGVVAEWPGEDETPTPTVLFFGRISRYKGLEVFYDAAPRIADRIPGVRFVVAGRPVGGYVPPAAPRLGGGAVMDVRARYLSTGEAAGLFRAASVVVCPYLDATQSGVVLTAFAFGVPVVATTTGGLPEYVIHNRRGILVPVGDAAALADAVCRILEDATLASRLRDEIVAAHTDGLSWRHTADALMRTYATALRD
jgi:glycosyltransferase involved in cell wall biosynthesis